MMDSIELPEVTVDFRREEVRSRDGARVELRPRPFGVLRRLATKAGEVVTKDDLLTECWPGVVVTEDSLTQCISEIRRALGEGGRDLVRTVQRRGYILVLPEVTEPPTPSVRLLPPPGFWPSIAVLPFDEFGTSAGQGMLGAGFAEDITTELGRNRELTVIARHSSFAAKAQGRTSAEIADMLGVRYLLEGSLRRAGERMVINAQLVDMRDSRHVWAERYSFSAAELFVVQDELAARIAGTLFSEVRVGEMAASLRRPPGNLDVYELVLQAEAHGRQLTRDSTIASRAEAERAVGLDPDFGRAHIRLGMTIAHDAGMASSGTVGPDALPGAIASIRRGIELEPMSAFGHRALSYALLLTGRFDEALQAAERSVAFGPSDAEILTFFGVAQGGVGRYAEALTSVERGIALNPLFPGYHKGIAAWILYALDRFEEASHAATACMERSPAFTFGYATGAAADVALGRKADAAARIAVLRRDYPGFTMRSPRMAQAYARDPKLRQRFLRHLREAGMPGGD